MNQINFITCPRCGDEVQEKAYGIHVSKTCFAIGKSNEELKKIREFNSQSSSVVDSLL
jgi:uncharacterized C2H2 Zn-finger protein